MTKIIYSDANHIEADMNRLIEGSSETERTAARMLKTMVPLLMEIVGSGHLPTISGFIRGLCQIAASVVISLPPFMREAVSDILLREMKRSLDIAQKGPPKGIDRG
jgi:hypothetical protein